MTGVIVGWLSASGDDCALWHIEHNDGDNEDLELHEVGSWTKRNDLFRDRMIGGERVIGGETELQK